MFQVKAKDASSLRVLANLYSEKSHIYDFWTEPNGLDHATDIMVPPAYAKTFVELLENYGMDYRVKIDNVQRYLLNSNNSNKIKTLFAF